MKLIGKLTLRFIFKNKLRMFLTLIGIVISIAMVTSVSNIVISTIDLLEKGRESYFKNYDFNVRMSNKEEFLNIKRSDFVDKTYTLQSTKELRFVKKYEGRKLITFARLNLINADSRFFKSSYDSFIVEGRLPENENEIIVPYSMKNLVPEFGRLGQYIDLDVFNKKVSANLDDYLNDRSSFSGYKYLVGELVEDINKPNSKEYVESKIEEFYSYLKNPDYVYKFKLVGYYRADNQTNIITDLTYDYNSKLISDYRYADVSGDIIRFHKMEEGSFDLYGNFVNLDNIDSKAASLLSIVDENRLDINWDKLNTKKIGISLFIEIFSAIIVFIVLIIFIAVLVFIYSIFNTNYIGRIKDLGLLKVVGFTNKQLVKMICLESMFYSIIGIPIGYLCGNIAMELVFSYINSILNKNLYGIYLNLEASSNIYVLVLTVFVGVAIILIANFSASFFVFKKTPIETFTKARKLKKVKGKKRFLIRRLFGYEGFLAIKNIDANRRRFTINTISISVSIVLFIVISYITTIFNQPIVKQVESNIVTAGHINTDLSNEKSIIDDISKIEDLKINHYYRQYHLITSIDHVENVSTDPLFISYNFLVLEDEYYNRFFPENKDNILFWSQFDSTLNEGDLYKIKIKRINNGTEGILYELNDRVYPVKNKKFIQDFTETSSDTILMSKSYAQKYYPKILDIDMGNINISLSRKGEEPLLRDKLDRISVENPETYVYGSLLPIIKLAKLLIYGFVALITSLCILNVINTTCNNVSGRTVDFALLKAVGVENKRMRKILLIEAVFSTILSSGLAFFLSFALTYFIYSGNFYYFFSSYIFGISIFLGPYALPFNNWLLGVVVTFVIIYLSSIIPYIRMSKTNISEVLK